jgi:predicted nucleotidyltransferase
MSTPFTKEDLEYIVHESEKNPDIVGLFLGGSRSKGYENPWSDWDFRMIVKDGKKTELEKVYKHHKILNLDRDEIDMTIWELSEFEAYAEWKAGKQYNRYSFADVEVLIDRDGIIKKLLERKSIVPPEELFAYTRKGFDAYLNNVYRAFKSIRKGDEIGSRIQTALSLHQLTVALFGIEGRMPPYPDYLEKELIEKPLKSFTIEKHEFVALLKDILETFSLEKQQHLLIEVEKYARANGYGEVPDSWEYKMDWMRTYKK